MGTGYHSLTKIFKKYLDSHYLSKCKKETNKKYICDMSSNKRYPKPRTFHPNNPQKYKGSWPIIIRSSLESKFFKICDNNQDILEWSSESLPIGYYSPIDKKSHTYWPDILIKRKKDNGKNEFVLIEIKPDVQTKKPKNTKNKQKKTFVREAKTYIVNCAKWKAAKKWCERRKKSGVDINFRVVTDLDLGI